MYYIIVQAVHVDEETRNSEMVEVTLATPGEKGRYFRRALFKYIKSVRVEFVDLFTALLSVIYIYICVCVCVCVCVCSTDAEFNILSPPSWN